MPGSSPTMARREPTILLKSVDLPTLGRPTMAMVGIFSSALPLIELDLILVKVWAKAVTAASNVLHSGPSSRTAEAAVTTRYATRYYRGQGVPRFSIRN